MNQGLIDELQQSYGEKRAAIRARLAEFAAIKQSGDDARLFEELCYCIFTAGASARMGLSSIARIRHHLLTGGQRRLENLLVGAHRFPRARARYIIHTRAFLQRECGLRLSEKLDSFGPDAEAPDAAVGLALIISVYRNMNSVDPEKLDQMKL